MSKMKQEDVERIAVQYVASLGVYPCLLDGSEFDDKDNPPVWRVYFSFCKSTAEEDEGIGLPNGLVVHVDDLTGTASSIPHL
jgi:hypothetical protein